MIQVVISIDSDLQRGGIHYVRVVRQRGRHHCEWLFKIEHKGFHIQLSQQRAHGSVFNQGALVDDADVAAQTFGFFKIMGG